MTHGHNLPISQRFQSHQNWPRETIQIQLWLISSLSKDKGDLTRKMGGSALSRTLGESRIKLRRREDIRRCVTLLKWERDNVSSGWADEICTRNVCGPVLDSHFSILGHLEDTCEPPTYRERVAICTCRLSHQDRSHILRLRFCLHYVA